MKYFKKYGKFFWCLLFCFLAFNLYFIFLLPEVSLQLLLYLDILLGIGMALFFLTDILGFYRREREIAAYLQTEDFIGRQLEDLENKAVIEHDFEIFQQKLKEQTDINRDLQDFVTKWCHEVKIPLSAAMLMNEKTEDSLLRMQLKEQLEKIKQDLNAVLVSCKVQGAFDDIQVHKLRLAECVNTSIKNNRYFLMKEKVELSLALHDETVYSDQTWLVYIIDQLLANAIKYAGENPKIQIFSEQKGNTVCLYIKDYGEGIRDFDLPRIFDRGYVGSNHHNGSYKSTGMGLYMVALMIKKLGHKITAESVWQEYTCFCITFQNMEQYFHL